jgi:hypothetical protein
VPEGRPVTGDQLTWIKSSRSIATGACVELASDEGLIALRNSRYSEVVLHFTREEIRAFVNGAARGEFNHLLE